MNEVESQKLSIWFPAIRAGSGSDVYVERLVTALRDRNIDANLQWFDQRYEFFPHLLRKVIPPNGTDLVHAISSWNGFAFARPPVPLIVTAFHCVYRNGYPQWKTRAQAIYHDCWIGRLERHSWASAAAIVALTPSAAADFRLRFTLPPLSIIPGWVDVDIFRPVGGSAGQRGLTRVLIVGNSSKRKGMDLLQALSSLLGDRFAITVVGGLRGGRGAGCAGIDYRQGLSLTELVHEYQQADIVVSLSRYEGFGYTALEAMACGKPVVAFDVVGLRDVVADCETGLLAGVDDVATLAALCKRLATHPDEAEAMGRAGRVRATDWFGKSAAVEAYIELYRSLVR